MLKEKSKVFKLVLAALMAALAIALELISAKLPFQKYTIYGISLMVCGLLLGPGYGFLSGLVSGIVIQLTSPYGITLTSPLWMLAPICWGGVSGLCSVLFKKFSIWTKGAIIVISCSISAFAVNTLTMFCEGWLMNDEYYTMANIIYNLPSRIITLFIMAVPYYLLLQAIYHALNQTFYIELDSDNIEAAS